MHHVCIPGMRRRAFGGALHQVRTKGSDSECFRVAGVLFRVCLVIPVAILLDIDLTFLGLVALVITFTERRLIS